MTGPEFWLLLSQLWAIASMMPNSPWRCGGCLLMSVLWFGAFVVRALGSL